MNSYGSIIKYRISIEKNIFLKIIRVFKSKYDCQKIIDKIPKKEFLEAKKELLNYDPYPGYSKYFDIKPWMLDMVWRAYILGLNKSKPKNILDIGTGNGYFPFCCKYYGHEVKSIDINDNIIFNKLISLLGVDRKSYAVKKYEPMPSFNQKFDLVTGFHIYFNGHRTAELWKKEEWQFFLQDLKNNHCSKNAELYFILNEEHDTLTYYDQDLLDFFISSGAEVDNNRVYYPNLNLI